MAGVAGAVRAEVGVIMATGEASLGASACHLKWHHKRHLTKLGKSKGGYCSARSWHTQWSVKLPMGNTPLRYTDRAACTRSEALRLAREGDVPGPGGVEPWSELGGRTGALSERVSQLCYDS